MKPKVRTSKSHPLQIASIRLAGCPGTIGVTICPGKKDPSSPAGPWRRDLGVDLKAIKAWGAMAVVCLMEEFELGMLGVPDLALAAQKAGVLWKHLPIVDVSVPDAAFELAWKAEGASIRSMLADGKNVLIHCRGGLGRSGMIAARLLIEDGLEPAAAVALVRKHRPGAIETDEQERYVLRQSTRTTATNPTNLGGSEDRAIGCLMGLAVGDALGTTLEFSARDSRAPVIDLTGGGPFRLKPGEWTDDTSMALCLADSLLARGYLDPTDLMSRFRDWRDKGHNSVTGHCFDIGITTTQAIGRYVVDLNPLAGSTNPEAAGNGSIMRLAPVAIFFCGNEAAAVEAGILQSQTTHGALECLDACRFMARLLQRLIRGSDWQEALGNISDGLKAPKILDLAAGKWRRKKRDAIRSTGYVVDTLEAALWAVNATSSFSEAALLAVNLGGDADTVGAVTGQLAGARYGSKGIPVDWIARLAWSRRISELARALYQTHNHRDR